MLQRPDKDLPVQRAGGRAGQSELVHQVYGESGGGFYHFQVEGIVFVHLFEKDGGRGADFRFLVEDDLEIVRHRLHILDERAEDGQVALQQVFPERLDEDGELGVVVSQGRQGIECVSGQQKAVGQQAEIFPEMSVVHPCLQGGADEAVFPAKQQLQDGTSFAHADGIQLFVHDVLAGSQRIQQVRMAFQADALVILIPGELVHLLPAHIVHASQQLSRVAFVVPVVRMDFAAFGIYRAEARIISLKAQLKTDFLTGIPSFLLERRGRFDVQSGKKVFHIK